MTRQIDQLENDKKLQEIVERYGLEASPELEEAKRKIAAYEKSIGRTESMINRGHYHGTDLSIWEEVRVISRLWEQCGSGTSSIGKSVSKTRSCFSLYDTGNFKRSWSERFAHAYHTEAYIRLSA